MRVVTGKVVGGQIVVEGDPLSDGSEVTVLCADEKGFDLTAEEEAELLQAIGEADRGDTIDADTLLSRIRRR